MLGHLLEVVEGPIELAYYVGMRRVDKVDRLSAIHRLSQSAMMTAIHGDGGGGQGRTGGSVRREGRERRT